MHRGSLFVSAGLLTLLLLSGGCGFLRQSPQAILPAAELYKEGEVKLGRKDYEKARSEFQTLVERHPDSPLAPRARFLIGEAYYRDANFDEAVKEFEAFMALYPSHSIADLAQYRLAMSFYDRMKPVEQDQAFTRKAMGAFRTLVREYPESRYASDALAKIDICRGRLAQKELWIAHYYYSKGRIQPARQRLEAILTEYSRTLVIPETLFLLAEIHWREGHPEQAEKLLLRLADDFSYTEWGRRAARRLAAQR